VYMRSADFKLAFIASTNVQPEFTTDLWELSEAHRRPAPAPLPPSSSIPHGVLISEERATHAECL